MTIRQRVQMYDVTDLICICFCSRQLCEKLRSAKGILRDGEESVKFGRELRPRSSKCAYMHVIRGNCGPGFHTRQWRT